MSKRNFLLAFILISFPFLTLTFAKGTIQNFEAKILDTSGVTHSIQAFGIQKGGFSLFGGSKEVPLASKLTFSYGMAEVTVPFENISKIEVKERDKKVASIQVTLTDGKKLDGKTKSKTAILGVQKYATSYKIQFQYMKTLEIRASNLEKCSICKRAYLPRK